MFLSGNIRCCNIRIATGITVLFFLLTGGAGAVQGEEWNMTYAGAGNTSATAVWQTTDGDYIFAGAACNNWCIPWLVRTDAHGNERWNRTYGENIYRAYSVQQTSDGGYILGGGMRPQRVSWSEADFDAYLIKTDGNGNEQWNRTLGGKYRDEARSVSKTRDGGYVLAGMTNSYSNSYWGDAWLVRTDRDGNEQWNMTYYMSSAIYSAASSVQETSDGGYILAGVIGPVNSSGKEAWLIKTDKNGNGQWNKTFGGKGNDGASSVQQTADGGYILAGSPTDEGAQDAWLIKTDTNGNEQWNLTFGGKFNAYSVAQTADGGYIMAGDTFPPGADDRVVWLIKVSGDNRNNETKMSPVEKAGGFEAALAITILLTLYKTGKRRIK